MGVARDNDVFWKNFVVKGSRGDDSGLIGAALAANELLDTTQ